MLVGLEKGAAPSVLRAQHGILLGAPLAEAVSGLGSLIGKKRKVKGIDT